MGRSFTFLVAFVLAIVASSESLIPFPTIVKHSLHVKTTTVNHLCKEQAVVLANETLPGPTIEVQEGDTLVVEVFNDSPYNITIHWHGIFQLLSAWADGPEYVTQCPIRPGNSYIYKFKITGQEGTLWWHAHSSWLRATVYGALIIHPRFPILRPFPKPEAEIPIVLGEWWNGNVVDIENEAIASGGAPNVSDAYTINGKPGDLYACSENDMYKLEVVRGKTYMLRIINAALGTQLFFKIAGHSMKVVAVDAVYTDHYTTDVVVIAPGQTTDVLLIANRPAGTSYFMAARAYASGAGVPFDNTTTRALLSYAPTSIPGAGSTMMPSLPAFNDTLTAHRFFSNLTARFLAPHWVPVPPFVNKRVFIAFGLGLEPCDRPNNAPCAGLFGQRFSASMNNQSFVIPSRARTSMLGAFFAGNTAGVYTTDFPDNPPTVFDYTDSSLSVDTGLLFAPKGTKVKRLEYNDVVEIVLQNTALIVVENHPIHLHGFNFHVLAQGFGNFDRARDSRNFNLLNPQFRNTIAVPVGGWAVIRFQANNPGVWLMHCHLDAHMQLGMTMAFEVQNGPTKSTTLPPPPSDFPQC